MSEQPDDEPDRPDEPWDWEGDDVDEFASEVIGEVASSRAGCRTNGAVTVLPAPDRYPLAEDPAGLRFGDGWLPVASNASPAPERRSGPQRRPEEHRRRLMGAQRAGHHRANGQPQASRGGRPPSRARAWLGRAWLVVFLGLAGWYALANRPADQPASRRTEPTTTVAARSSSLFKPIEAVQAGERSWGRNPQRDQVDESLPDPDPATWRLLKLHMLKQSGRSLWIDLLRSIEWIELAGASPGEAIWLDLPEMGALGEATVLEIRPCPPIQPGPGNVVTGKFVHEADGNVVELRLEGEPGPTGVTNNHLYWSVDREDYVPAGELRAGEQVDTAGGTTRVASVTPIAYSGLLYNLEIHGEHVYRVGSLGTLVHNNCATGSFFGKTPKQILRARPKGWVKVAAERGHGWKLVDKNGVERVRFMYPDKRGRFVHERTGYWRRMDENRNFLDVDGQIVPLNHALFNYLTHIPLSGLR